MIHPTANKTSTQKILWHLKVALGAMFISLVFSLVLRKQLIHSGLPSMFILIFIELEIFIWLGNLFFQSLRPDAENYLKKALFRLVLFYLLVLVFAFVFFLGIYAYHFIKNGEDFSYFFPSLFQLEMKGFFMATVIGFAFGAIFFFYTQWAEALKREQKLVQEKLIFQYETLKSQVNPHFLFNSLNSLSSLVKKDPDLSELYIQKLSTIYRYILENDNKELVPLSEEMQFVKNYFYLQKIRDEEKIELNIELNETENIQVLPVSVQLLVENALKHNSATRKQPLVITIHFEGLDKLVVRNNLQKKMQLNDSSKIGLKNLKERSMLILNRRIEILETTDEFVVKIPVEIN